MKRWILFCACLFATLTLTAQVLSWTPPFPREDDPTQTLVITADATKGDQGLLNYTPATDVFVHIGVITTLSTGPSDWKYVQFTWATTPTQANAPSAGTNRWAYTINGSLRSFFNITNPAERIVRISILFRNGTGNRVLRNSDGSDMYVPVYGNSLAVRIDQPARDARFNPTPEVTSYQVGANVPVQARASANSTITLFHNGTQIATASNVQTLSASANIAAVGNQQIIAVATDGTTTSRDTLNVLATSSAGSPVAALPAGVRDGINYEPGDTSVTLVLRAPGKNLVVVTGEFNNWTPGASAIMNRTPDGRFFWIRITGLMPSVQYAYQYIVDGNLRIADPYAEMVLDPNNDRFIDNVTYPNLRPYPPQSSGATGIVSVLQTRPPAYNWAVNNFSRPDKRGLITYELLLRDFVAAHNWRTLTDTLNYLQRLGVNTIHVMPFNEFEGNISWGYNPSFMFAPDKYYGTPNALKAFVDSCHRRGMAVVMDMVLNHQFGQSPMVQLYWDAANNRPAANSPWFNPVAKHAFNVGYDMNHQSADTRYFFSRVVEHWLREYKLDGFRFDLSKGFTQVQTCDNNGNNCDVGAWSNYDASRIAIWRGYYDTLMLKSPGSYVILEHFAANQEEIELSNYGMLLWGNMHWSFNNAIRGDNTGNNSNLSGALASDRGWSQNHLMSYMESHDEERMMVGALTSGIQVGQQNPRDTTQALLRVQAAAAFLFNMPGPKLMWQFGEQGYDFSINRCENGTIDNNCRTNPKPIRWDYLNQQRRRNLYNAMSRIIGLRSHPWFRQAYLAGTTDYSLAGSFKWMRVNADTSRIVVIGNFDVNPLTSTFTFPLPGTWFNVMDSTVFSATGSAQSFTLQPGEYRIYVNRNLYNVTVTSLGNSPNLVRELEAKVYPNPARSQAWLQFRLPSAGQITVELFNGTGQRVSLLRQGFMPAGSHQLPVSTHALSGGSYYLRITTKAGNAVLPVQIQ